MSFEELERSGGFHLRRDDALEVFLDWEDVDGAELTLVDDELKDAAEGLCLLAFPMEVLADGDFMEREGSVVGLWLEGEALIHVVVP